MADKSPTKFVKLSTCLSGVKTFHKPGDVIEVDAAEADRHAANGNGTICDKDGNPVTAAAPAVKK